MSGSNTNEVTNEVTHDAASVRSLDALKAQLKARSAPDVSQLPQFEHKGIGATFRIKPMNRDGYHAVECADLPDATVDEWPLSERLKFRGYNRDKAYLKFGCVLDDGASGITLDDETVKMMLEGAWDADNRQLIHAIRKANPPRETLLAEYQASIAVNRMILVLFRILREAGALQKLRDWLLADSDSDEAKTLADDLRKWEAVALPFEAILEVEDGLKTVREVELDEAG